MSWSTDELNRLRLLMPKGKLSNNQKLAQESSLWKLSMQPKTQEQLDFIQKELEANGFTVLKKGNK